jgi:hypothetical protein
LITGTPTVAAVSTVTLSATNATGTGNATLTLTIGAGSPVITSATTASGTVGTAFSYQITATNTPTNFGATGLPASLSINTATGLITGTPTAAAVSTVTLSATNATGTGNATLTLTIIAAAPVITSATTAGGPLGHAFSYQITATNAPTSYGAVGLPGGLSLNTATGLITGTPTTAAVSTVTLSATNAAGTGNATLTLTITSTSTTFVSFVQTVANVSNGVKSLSVAFPTSTVAGNLILIAFDFPGSATVSSIADTQGNIFTQVGTQLISPAGFGSRVYYAKNIKGGADSVTVTFLAASGFIELYLTEYAGADQANPIDAQAGATGNVGPVSSGNATTTVAGDLIYGYCLGDWACTLGSGFTARSMFDGNVIEDAMAGSPGAYAATGTGINGGWTMQMVALKSSSSLDTTPPNAPTNLTATPVSSSQINLSWTASTDNVGVTGHLLERCLGAGCTTFAQIASLSGTTTSYNDTGLTASTSYSYRVRGTDAAGNLGPYSNVASGTTAIPGASPVITSATTAGGTIGVAFAYQITATNAPSSYGAAGLPAGLSLNAATGLISGTPTAVATSTVTLSATNGGGTGNATLTLTISPALPVITSAITSSGTVGSAFSYQITATNAPTSYGAAGLPAGLSLNTATGLISGNPTVAVTSTLTLTATNSGGTGSASLTLTIAAAGSLTVSPRTTALTFTRTQQFTASATGVSWQVDGVTGGSATAGSISASGLYTPPASAGTHTVTATTSDRLQSGNATVLISDYAGKFTHQNDNGRTGQNLNESILTPSNVNQAQFGKLFSYALDGQAYASPLYVADLNIPGQGFHNVVYVATEHDSVYAFDADGLVATPLWQVSFINPAAGITPVPSNANPGICCDIDPEIGMTGTPVIDQTTGTLYVVARTAEVSGGITNYVQRLHALDIATGAPKFGGSVLIQASVPALGGQEPFAPLTQNQRAALLLSNGVVYVAFGSHSDQYPFHGWILGYNASTLQQVMVFCTTPNSPLGGGIWQSGGGPATDATGNIYFITGNGTFNGNTGGTEWADSFIKLSPSGVVLDYFTPHDQANMDAHNLDLGSGGVMVLPDQLGPVPRLVGGAGKSQTVYLVNRDNMGHFNPTNDSQIVQTLINIFPNGFPEPGNFIPPVYFNGTIYFSPINDTVQAFRLTNGLLTAAPTSHSSTVYAFPGGAMAISANGSTNGILWSVQFKATAQTLGILRAYDATNLATELYNSNQAGSRDTMDSPVKYNTPAVANGKVFVGANSSLVVYGLLP